MADSDEPRPPEGKHFVIGADHAGRELKERLKQHLIEAGNRVEDRSPQSEKSDYPLVGEDIARQVAGRQDVYGLLVCGTGIGVAVAANKVRGVRAALLYNKEAARYARQHNNANVLVFGGRTMDYEEARRCLDAFFEEQYEGGRHERRNRQIAAIEERTHPGEGA